MRKHRSFREIIGSTISTCRFRLPSSRNIRSVLIVEPHAYHGILLPGYARYLLEQGYSVDVFLRHENATERPFCRFPENKRLRLFPLDRVSMAALLRKKVMRRYDLVFFTTLEFYESGLPQQKYMDYLGVLPQSRYGILGVYHTLTAIARHSDEQMADQGRIFGLSELAGWKERIPMCSPVYVGDVRFAGRSQGLTRFIAVGAVARQTKDHDSLLAAASELSGQGCTNFQITIIGEGNLTIPESLAAHIRFLGKVAFPVLFDELEAADFILPLLTTEKGLHARFLESVTSGSKLLSLIFRKPPVMQKEFADFWGFTETHAVIHAEGGLCEAMKRALQTNTEQYGRFQNSLKGLQESVMKKSQENLHQRIERMKHGG